MSLAATVPAEVFDLSESVSLLEATDGVASVPGPDGMPIHLGHNWQGEPKPGGVFDAKGRVPVFVIRPGIGRGRGKHLYESAMLAQAAPTFAGWKMYVDHLSPEARKAANGQPRSTRDLGGRLTESWWNPDVAKTDRFDQGAVVGMAKPTPFMGQLIDHDPEIVEASISASATGVHPVTRDGQRVWCVEGIHDRGSVDFVTEAGAGGQVASILMEAYASEEAADMALLESLTDDELRERLEVERPGLLAANIEESTDMTLTAKDLQEALTSNPEVLVEALQTSEEVQTFFMGLVESGVEAEVSERIDTERELIRAEAKAEALRESQLVRLDVAAERMIAESTLPEAWQAPLREKFRIDEATGEPTADLDAFIDEVDDDGNVTQTAHDALRESLADEITRERDRLAAARPTRVREQGRSTSGSSEGGTSETVDPTQTSYGQLFESAGVDAKKMYGGHRLESDGE